MNGDLLLRELGVRKEARLFFAPYYKCVNRSLIFDYGIVPERFGVDGHFVPGSGSWKAGNVFGSQLFICSSAMEAIAFLSLNWNRFKADELLFVAFGNCMSKNAVTEYINYKNAALVLGRDVFGRLWDIKIAGWLNKHQMFISFENHRFRISWRDKEFYFGERKLTLNAFERLSSFRGGVRTYKSKGYYSFLEQLINS